jgi:type II secretory pathway component GspD/PulD (secretin)
MMQHPTFSGFVPFSTAPLAVSQNPRTRFSTRPPGPVPARPAPYQPEAHRGFWLPFLILSVALTLASPPTLNAQETEPPTSSEIEPAQPEITPPPTERPAPFLQELPLPEPEDPETHEEPLFDPPAFDRTDSLNLPADGPPRGSRSERVVSSARTLNPSSQRTIPTPQPGADPQRGLRLNFRGAPLDLVLDYLSDAAGFIINVETELKGKVDVWSNQPLSRDEAVALLDTVLARHGFAAIRHDRTLTIVGRDEAKKRDIPVVSGNNPEDIPRSDEIVTQIIPVRFISATLLVRDLQGLLPESAALTANEGGNALVLTDTRASIRRMTEIVQALDTAVSSVSTVRVFALRFADAKTLATMIRDLFQSQETTGRNQPGGNAARFMQAFRGGPGGGNQGGNAAADPSGGRAPTPRVVAVADERSNSIVVSAPEEQMVVIESVVEEVDTDVEDITELRVFRLRHADPSETATLLASLFPDPTTTTRGNNNQRGPRFGGQNAAATDSSSRALNQSRVIATPDLRTGSVVVSASRNLMTQIAVMISQLDEDPARKQQVFVYSVEDTDPQAVQQVLQSLFPDQNTSLNRNTRNNQNQGANQLNTRQTQSRNNTGNTRNTGLGTGTGFGTGTGGGTR